MKLNDNKSRKYSAVSSRKSMKVVQTEKALHLWRAVSDITERGNNAEVRRKKDGSLTVYEVKKNIVTV